MDGFGCQRDSLDAGAHPRCQDRAVVSRLGREPQSGLVQPRTGLAPEFWGRSIGWVPVAIQDVVEQMDPDDERRAALELYVRDLLTSLCAIRVRMAAGIRL